MTACEHCTLICPKLQDIFVNILFTMANWQFVGVNIRQTLEGKFGFPVIVEHEVLLLLTNDMQLYDLSQLDCVIGIYLGTGFGNAIYIHGRLLEGANGVSGELGHIPVVGADWVCPCGSVGCIEMISAEKRLEVIKNEHFPEESTFEGVFAHGASNPVVAEYIDNIACAIATEINILDPDRVILGGGVINTPNFPYEALVDQIRFRARKPYPSQTLQFIHPEKDSLQGIRGAGIYGWKHLEN